MARIVGCMGIFFGCIGLLELISYLDNFKTARYRKLGLLSLR
jgi:hypothetical protein